MIRVSLQSKILLPFLIILLLVEFSLGFTSYQNQKTQLIELMKQETQARTNQVKSQLKSNNVTLEVLKNSLKENYLKLVSSVAEIVQHDPTYLESSKLQQLAKQIKVNEIHVTDHSGVLRYSSTPQFIGFDFKSTEQTKPFLQLGEEGLAQDPAKRGADDKLFMYIGVNRLDKNGIVQIGVQPDSYQKALDNFHVGNLIRKYSSNTKGFVFLFKDGQLIASTNNGDKQQSILTYI